MKGESRVAAQKYQVQELSEFALEMVRQAGQKALTYYGKGQPDTKFDEGLITETELHLMDYFQDQLNSRFPDHQIFRGDPLGNEYTHGQQALCMDFRSTRWRGQCSSRYSHLGHLIGLGGKFLASVRRYFFAGHRRRVSSCCRS